MNKRTIMNKRTKVNKRTIMNKCTKVNKRTFTNTKKVFINKTFLFMNGIAPKCLETYYQSSSTICQKMGKIGGVVSEKK